MEEKWLTSFFTCERQLCHNSVDLTDLPELLNTKYSDSCWNQRMFYSVPLAFVLSALCFSSLYLCQGYWTAEICYSHLFFLWVTAAVPFILLQAKLSLTLNSSLSCSSSTVQIFCEVYRFLCNMSIFRTGASQIKKAVCKRTCYGYHRSRTNTLCSDDGLRLMQLSKTYGLTPAIKVERLHIQLQHCVFLSWWKSETKP